MLELFNQTKVKVDVQDTSYKLSNLYFFKDVFKGWEIGGGRERNPYLKRQEQTLAIHF